VEGFEQFLREHGPLSITADEDPSAKSSVHPRPPTGLRGDETPDGTIATFLDTIPNAPSPSTETVATLQRKLADLAIGQPQAAELSGRR
jgi:hypothetical protein